MNNELADAVESGDLFGCPECHEVSEGRHCPDCHDGACGICGALILKGEAADRDGADVFCGVCVERTTAIPVETMSGLVFGVRS
jgi:hypothetical protein